MNKKGKSLRTEQKIAMPLVMQNRGYNASMRDVYFRKAVESFTELNREYSHEAALFSESARLLEFQSNLDIALEYAKISIVGIFTEERNSFTRQGFYREEILFVHLLEDCSSACRFLCTRHSTILELSDYKRKISALSLAGRSGGYVSRILKYIDEKNSRDDLEIRQIIGQIEGGLELAGTLYETIKVKSDTTELDGKIFKGKDAKKEQHVS
jgi:hypothetical protein